MSPDCGVARYCAPRWATRIGHASSIHSTPAPARRLAARWQSPPRPARSPRHSVLQHGLFATDLLQSCFPTVVVEFLEAVEAIPTVAHHFARRADVAQRLGQFQQPDLVLDDLLVRIHTRH